MATQHAKAVARGKADAAKKAGVSSSTKLAKATTKKDSGKSTSSQYDALMKKYTSTLTPTKTETDATKQLGDLTQSSALGVAKQGQEVMPMDVITGSQANITQQASLKSAPLTQLIASEQAKRSASGDVLTSQTGLLEKKMAGEQAAATTAAENASKLQLAQIAASKKSGTAKKATVSDILGSTDNWDVAAANAKKAGIPTYHGSAFDVAAKKRWLTPSQIQAEKYQ